MSLKIALLAIKEHANRYTSTTCLIDESTTPSILQKVSIYNPKFHHKDTKYHNEFKAYVQVQHAKNPDSFVQTLKTIPFPFYVT
jgi:hypothetical protein